MNRLPFWYVAAAPLLSASIAHAAPPSVDKDLARKLYQLAAADMEREAYEQACPQFEAALQLDPEHIRTAMTLGTCEDRWGKLLRAMRRFEYARSLAVAQSVPNKLAEIDQLIADLSTRLPKLRIIVPEHIIASSGLIIVRNGMTVAPADFGQAVPIDPGMYEIAATTTEHVAWKAKVDIKEGQTAEITVGAAQAATYRPNSPEDATRARDLGRSSSARGSTARTVGISGIGIGAAGIIAGGILGSLAIVKNRASDDGHCNASDECNPTGTRLRLEAQRYGNASTILFAAGGAVLTTGIILVATSPSTAREKQPLVQTSFWIGPAGIGLRGRW